MDNLYGLPSLPLPHLGERQARGLGRATCEALVARIHVGGYRIENDRFPRIADERWVRLTLLQHLPELVDVRTSREMWMLYTSVRPEAGPAVGLWTGGAGHRHRQHGGRPDIPGHPEVPALGWEERARDPRLARCWSGDIVTHSPEGRMRRGFLARPRARVGPEGAAAAHGVAGGASWRPAVGRRPPLVHGGSHRLRWPSSSSHRDGGHDHHQPAVLGSAGDAGGQGNGHGEPI